EAEGGRGEGGAGGAPRCRSRTRLVDGARRPNTEYFDRDLAALTGRVLGSGERALAAAWVKPRFKAPLSRRFMYGAGRLGRLLLWIVTGGGSGRRSAFVLTDRRLLLARGGETTTARELISLHEIASVRATERPAPNVPGVPTGPSLALSVEGKGGEMTMEVPLPLGRELFAAIEYGRAADRTARAV